MKQASIIQERKELLNKQAEILGLDLNYEPQVVMDDITEAPESLWHEARRSGWGGSDEGALNSLGFASLQQTTMQKVLGVKPSIDDDLQHIFDYGHANEWVMLKAYAQRNGYKYLTNKNYYVVVREDVDTKKYPFLKANILPEGTVYTAKYNTESEAKIVLDSLIKDYPTTEIVSEDCDASPKDIRDITEEEHNLYDAQGIVCVDRRQYRSPIYHSMLGDCDGICITPSGEKIGIECKTYSYQKAGSFTSGLLGEEGVKIKNPEYALQVAHYLHVMNLNRFDIVSMCGNLPTDINITTVLRDLQLEKELCENCENKWKYVENNEFPEENTISNDKFNTLVELIMQKPKITEIGLLDDENLDFINEIESYNEKIKELESKIDALNEDANKVKAKIVSSMQEGNKIYEKALVHSDGFDYLVSAVSSEQNRLDEKKLKAQCPELYAEYKKSHSFTAYLDSCEPEVKAEYQKCSVSTPKLKITKVKSGSVTIS